MVRADLDRTNLGNARLQGLPEHVLGGDPTGVLFDWANSAFFFSYVSICCLNRLVCLPKEAPLDVEPVHTLCQATTTLDSHIQS